MHGLEGYRSNREHQQSADGSLVDAASTDQRQDVVIHANHADLYETIYIEETATVQGSAMLFRCSMVLAAALIAFGGLQFYKGFSQDRLLAKTGTLEKVGQENTATEPAIDPTTTASIGKSTKIVERSPEPVIIQTNIYVIQPGDTLSAIGRKHGVTAKSIMAANGIDNPRLIKPGMKLKILKN